MDDTQLQSYIHRVQAVKNGFGDIRNYADEIAESQSAQELEILAQQLFASESHQVRMLAVFLMGKNAAESDEMLLMMRERVSLDGDWRVQEILAQAFDQFCKDRGYEQALPFIADWLSDANPNVRRAVSEGLRIWTTRPYFREHPELAVNYLSALHADSSEYVRKSVGNALRDISRKYPDLIREAVSTWDTSQKPISQTYKLAVKFL